jgi:hypothetical protein
MGFRVPYSRTSPAIFKGNNTSLLTQGGLEFFDGTLITPHSGNPSGSFSAKKGSLVLDITNAKLYQNTDGATAYSVIGASTLISNDFQFNGTGAVGDELKLTGYFAPTVDSTSAWRVYKADAATLVASIDTMNTQFILQGKVNLGKVDAFGRTMMWNYGTNSVLKLGGIQQDGDPADVSSEGVVLIGANSAGAFDYNNWAFVRLKSTRLGINNCIANVQSYIFRADELGLYLRNDAGTKTFEVIRSTGVTILEGAMRPRVDGPWRVTNVAGTLQFGVDTIAGRVYASTAYTPTLQPDLTTKKYVDNADSLKVSRLDSAYTFPSLTSENFAGTVRTATDEASLLAAMTASATGDSIQITANITLTATFVVNKSVRIFATGGQKLQSAGAAGDPVTLISVTAANVLFENFEISHAKTTNTSVECAVSVNALGFVSRATVKFMEFGYILRGSFSIEGPMVYTGALGNNHRFVAVYGVSAASRVEGVTFDSPQEATARSSFIYVSSAGAADKLDSHLRIANCRQLDMTKYIRQFFMQDAAVTTADGLASLTVERCSWNDLNGGIGFFLNRASLLAFFYHITVVGNWQGDAGIASYKGIIYLDSSGTPGNLGATRIRYGANRHPTAVRVDYTSAYDFGGICYRTAAYSLATAIESQVVMPESSEYSLVFRSLYQKETAASIGTLIAGSSAVVLDDADKIGVADVSASNVLANATLADLKAFLKTYFDTLYTGGSGGDMAFANTSITGTQNIVALAEVELSNYTVPVGKTAQWISGIGSADGLTRFRVTVDGTDVIPPIRTSLSNQSVTIAAPLQIAAGSVLRVFGYNDSLEGNTNSVTATLYLNVL